MCDLVLLVLLLSVPGRPGDGARRWRAGRFVTQNLLSRHLRPRGPYRAFKRGPGVLASTDLTCAIARTAPTLVKQFGVKQ